MVKKILLFFPFPVHLKEGDLVYSEIQIIQPGEGQGKSLGRDVGRKLYSFIQYLFIEHLLCDRYCFIHFILFYFFYHDTLRMARFIVFFLIYFYFFPLYNMGTKLHLHVDIFFHHLFCCDIII